ncbi:2'-5'-oligoadenylate synthase 3-like isoform X2 [Asterias amurensis]|uniref:2'-5'-oligoadenylate synthase 3-like isoform X2 n=1 Tax=Asterias amurensis TaxID=7602 RepID=UPI003AB81C62
MDVSPRFLEPWCMDPKTYSLETWYNENIQCGTDAFDSDCRKAIDEVVQRIWSSGGVLFNFNRIVKGGSLGKGTMVKDLSDVDLIAFINPPNLAPIVRLGPAEYKRKLAVVIRDLHSALKRLTFVSDVSNNDLLVYFNIRVGRRCLKVNFLPTSDNCAGHGRAHSDMFRAMLQLHNDKDREFYSASLAEHQLSFVGSQPRYVKELVRLVKYWANDYLPGYLQNSYGLELITIHLWEKAGKPVRFSKAQGLKRVLRALTRLTALRVTSWSGSRLYDATLAQSAITQLRMINPIVLDPANPTNNVCQLYQQGTNGREIASAAGQTLQTQLLMKVKVRQGWKEGAGSNFKAAQGGARSVLEIEKPWCLSQGDLETWYNENIQLGTEEFARECQSAISRVVRFVHSNCSLDILEFDVDKVVKGGSLGKGTMVKDLSDVDLVAFVNKPYVQPIAEIGKDAYKETITGINFNIASTLELNPDVKDIKHDEYVVKFEIDVGSRWIEVDLLPTTDNIKSHSSYEEMFRYMLSKGHGTRQYCSPSLVHRQVQFVKEQPGNVKELIRLVKYWASRFLPKYLQKSYPLELITIYLWEKAGRPERRLNKAQGLRSVLEVLTNLEELCASWQYMHKDEHITQAIIKKDNMERPIVLDPANPTFNVCYMYQWKDKITGDPFMKVIKAAAEKTLRTTLLSDVTAWPNLSGSFIQLTFFNVKCK